MTSLAVQTNVNTIFFFFFVELLHPTGSGEDRKTQAEKKSEAYGVLEGEKALARTALTTQSGNVKSGGSSSLCNKPWELPPGSIISSQIMTTIFNLLFLVFLVMPSFLEMNNNP